MGCPTMQDIAAFTVLAATTTWDVRVGVLTYLVHVLAGRIHADWRRHNEAPPTTNDLRS